MEQNWDTWHSNEGPGGVSPALAARENVSPRLWKRYKPQRETPGGCM